MKRNELQWKGRDCRRTHRFDDPFGFFRIGNFIENTFEQEKICWQDKGLRNEVELSSRVHGLHVREISPQTIFPSDLKWTRKMIDLNEVTNSFEFSSAAYLLVFTDGFETDRFHVPWPCSEPIISLWKSSACHPSDEDVIIETHHHLNEPRRWKMSENDLLSLLPPIKRNPERMTVFFTMFGVIVLIFHFIIFRNGNGSCSTNRRRE